MNEKAKTTNPARAPIALSGSGTHVAPSAARAGSGRLDAARAMTTDALKAAWDAFDADAERGGRGYYWPGTGPHVEDVHRVLNERGEGEYCAV